MTLSVLAGTVTCFLCCELGPGLLAFLDAGAQECSAQSAASSRRREVPGGVTAPDWTQGEDPETKGRRESSEAAAGPAGPLSEAGVTGSHGVCRGRPQLGDDPRGRATRLDTRARNCGVACGAWGRRPRQPLGPRCHPGGTGRGFGPAGQPRGFTWRCSSFYVRQRPSATAGGPGCPPRSAAGADGPVVEL